MVTAGVGSASVAISWICWAGWAVVMNCCGLKLRIGGAAAESADDDGVVVAVLRKPFDGSNLNDVG